jgi:hypothetical protein
MQNNQKSMMAEISMKVSVSSSATVSDERRAKFRWGKNISGVEAVATIS